MSNTGKRVVVKIGSALITNNGQGLNLTAMSSWAFQLVTLQQRGFDVILVSSGAIAAGMMRFQWHKRPESMAKLQAAAAVGQSQLVQEWERAFGAFECMCALILLDAADLANRERYINARAALLELMSLGVIPIINENDTVVTDEIRFGDNDSLAGLVANLVDADELMILTDQDGLFTADPRKDKKAQLVERASADDQALSAYAQGSKGELGRGGMQTKLRAAKLAARSGTNTFIGNGLTQNIVIDSVTQDALGTYLSAGVDKLVARKRWLAGMSGLNGTLVVDGGAAKKLINGGASLLPVGVVEVHGQFERGDMVVVQTLDGIEIAKGLINYSYSDAKLLAGKSTSSMCDVLGCSSEPEMIHRDNMVVELNRLS